MNPITHYCRLSIAGQALLLKTCPHAHFGVPRISFIYVGVLDDASVSKIFGIWLHSSWFGLNIRVQEFYDEPKKRKNQIGGFI